MTIKKTNKALLSRKGKMTQLLDGQLLFTPYAENSGSRYNHLYFTAHGEVKTTNEKVIIRLAFPKKWNKYVIANALIHETDDMAEFITEC